MLKTAMVLPVGVPSSARKYSPLEHQNIPLLLHRIGAHTVDEVFMLFDDLVGHLKQGRLGDQLFLWLHARLLKRLLDREIVDPCL